MSTYWRNVALTLFVGAPLLGAFVRVVNFYPVPVWSLFSERGELATGRRYHVLLGRTADGSWKEIPPVRITAGLYGRLRTLVSYADANLPLTLDSPHPDNVRLVERAGGPDRLPRGARMPELLRAWGTIYNRRLPPDSPERLTGLRLEARRWPGGRYGDYDQLEYVWEVEL